MDLIFYRGVCAWCILCVCASLTPPHTHIHTHTPAIISLTHAQVRLEYRALVYSTIGGIVGICVGLEYVAPALPPAYSKMLFVSIWGAFAFSLYWLNRTHGRKVYLQVSRADAGAYIAGSSDVGAGSIGSGYPCHSV
jgi:hypothetical protein